MNNRKELKEIASDLKILNEYLSKENITSNTRYELLNATNLLSEKLEELDSKIRSLKEFIAKSEETLSATESIHQANIIFVEKSQYN